MPKPGITRYFGLGVLLFESSSFLQADSLTAYLIPDAGVGLTLLK